MAAAAWGAAKVGKPQKKAGGQGEGEDREGAGDGVEGASRVGGALVLGYVLKPCHNPYRLETRLLSSYPTVPPETRVITPLKHCPHLLEGQSVCMWRQGSTRASSRWDPAQFTCVFAVLAAWRWLACYEIWHETGEWPLPEAK